MADRDTTATFLPPDSKLPSEEVPSKPRIIALVGNPNVGKSVIFSRLTGQYAQVSNYPGTTVTLTRGRAEIGGVNVEVVDTPGINSLVPQSEDERVTRDILLGGRPDVVLLVADAKNLRRTLLLMSQLAELQLPTVLDLNMADEARKRGVVVDAQAVSEAFGIPVVETVATEGHGLKELTRALQRPLVPRNPIADVETIARELQVDIQHDGRLPLSLFAEWLVSSDRGLKASLTALVGSEHVDAVGRAVERYEKKHQRPAAVVVSQARIQWIDTAVERMRRIRWERTSPWAERLGRWCREPLTGIPILLGVLFLMYYFVGSLGAGVAVDFLEDVVFGRYVIPATTWVVDRVFPVRWIRDFLVGPYGIISMGLTYSVAIVLPVVGTFFLAFGVLEDSGYLPRLAVLADRLFRYMGLNGKAVLPMVLGLGCVTMATLTTRILPSRKERLLATLLLALAVPCAAQIGVVLGMMAWVSFRAVLFLFAVLVLQMLIVGWLADRLLPGKRSDFVVELPPMRVPVFGNLIRKTWSRVNWFLKEAVPLFILGTAILFVLDRLYVLPLIVRAAEPLVVGWLGLPAKTAEAFVMGFLRRDYGAAGLFEIARQGQLDHTQIMVSLVTMTLFVPCVANFFVIIKEHSFKKALLMVGFIVPYAVLVGGMVNLLIRWTGLEF